MSVQYLASPIGVLRLCADQRKLRQITPVQDTGPEQPNPITQKAAAELQEYFSGKRTEFTVAALPHGTAFQQKVWSALSRVPYGRVVTYGELAAAIGQPTACRAVANAVGKNPLLIFIPCHRVVGASGLGGFSAGLEAKRALLTLEGVQISEKSPFSEKFFFTFP